MVHHGRVSLGRVVPVGHNSSGPAALNFALDYPQYVYALCLLNSFYGRTPTLRFPEFIELFATKNIQPLTQALLRSPEQFGWVLNFQRAQGATSLLQELPGAPYRC